MTENEKSYKKLVAKISAEANTDVVILNAGLWRHLDANFIESIRQNRQHENLLLILVTGGGDADVAYRIARYAQDSYKKFTVFVSGICKSAGTLCVLGAHEVVMRDEGELGPLDVQLSKKDDLGDSDSGLVYAEALQSLQRKAYEVFVNHMLSIKAGSRNRITFKLAAEVAAEIAIGLFEPMYRQIDPVMIGNVERSMAIATQYGMRLLAKSKNNKLNSTIEQVVDSLVNDYPSHGFVIDRDEAGLLFNNIRKPSDDEECLARILGEASRIPGQSDLLSFLSYQEQESDDNLKGKGDGNDTTAETGTIVQNKGSRGGRKKGTQRNTGKPKDSKETIFAESDEPNS